MDLSDGTSGSSIGQPLSIMIINLMGTKTNSDSSNRDYGVAMRNKFPLTCAIGSLSFYLFLRYSSQNWPAFHTNQDWFQVKV